MKCDLVTMVPDAADGFRATVRVLRSLVEGEGVSFQIFSLPEDRFVRLLIKNLGTRMPEAEILEELAAMHIDVQGVMQLRSRSRDMDRPLTTHFIVSVARGPGVVKLRALTEICGLRIKVETYVAPKGPMKCKRFQYFGHTQRNCDYATRCVACGDVHPSNSCSTLKQ